VAVVCAQLTALCDGAAELERQLEFQGGVADAAQMSSLRMRFNEAMLGTTTVDGLAGGGLEVLSRGAVLLTKCNDAFVQVETALETLYVQAANAAHFPFGWVGDPPASHASLRSLVASAPSLSPKSQITRRSSVVCWLLRRTHPP
jgi:hypothetical protein